MLKGSKGNAIHPYHILLVWKGMEQIMNCILGLLLFACPVMFG